MKLSVSKGENQKSKKIPWPLDMDKGTPTMDIPNVIAFAFAIRGVQESALKSSCKSLSGVWHRDQ